MDLRTRVLKVLDHDRPDMVPWLGDLDYWIYYLNTSGNMPEQYKVENGIYRLYRDLGVGFYLQGYFPFKGSHEGIKFSNRTEGNISAVVVETPAGTLQGTWQYLPDSYAWGPREHLVKGVEDLKVLRYWYEHTHYEADYRQAEERYLLAGDNGLVLCYMPKSPFMHLVADLAGIEAVTYMLQDDPDEFDETIEVLGKKTEESALIALNSPAECLMIPENLSSEVVGKRMFEKYMRGYEEHWNKKIKEAGKYSFIHMDGTLRGLISEVASAGFNVLEALTPAPVGDIPLAEIDRWVGRDTILWGGIPGVYFTDFISDSEFDRFVIEALEIMKTEPRYVLGVADQVPPGARWERVRRVGELVGQYGRF